MSILTPARYFRRRRSVARSIRRYEKHLKALHSDRIPFSRANKLDLMALIAESISAAEYRTEEAVREWGATAHLLRAVAATERFQVLTDPDLFGEIAENDGAGLLAEQFRPLWHDLAAAAARGDNRARARILQDLCSAASDRPGVLVLDDIAATELAAADAYAHIAGCFQHWLDRLGFTPRALCGVSLAARPGDPEIIPGSPACPECDTKAVMS